MPVPIDLTQKTVLITGATGQLGRVMVDTFATAGANVAIHCRNSRHQAETLETHVRTLGRQACVVSGDMGNWADVQSIKETIDRELGAPHIVVTNAVSQIFPWRTVLEEELGDYQNQFESCVLHNVHVAKAFVPAMIENGGGRFIGINTECTIQTLQTQSAYVSGKAGMDGVLRVLAKEVGPHNVTVNQVAPGWTISYRDRDNGTEDQPEYTQNVPLRRRGTDREVANAVLFFASDLASFVTGTFLPVNGGHGL